MFDFTVVGNAGIDTNVYFYTDDIDFDKESSFTQNIDCVGQAGGYSTRGFAQLGYKTAFIGSIGNDFCGEMIKEAFRGDNIDTKGIFLDKTGTARSINFMYPDGRRKNFYDGKNHMNIKPNLEICNQIIKESKLVHFNIPNWARELLPVAKSHKKIISVDLQDVIGLEDNYRDDFIKYADIIFFSCTNFSSPKQVFDNISQKFPEKILISGLGAKGCATYSNGRTKYFKAIDLEQPVIDCNGAGDSLAVGFLSSYFIEKYSMEDSILRGQISARYVCTQKASTDKLIKKPQLDKLFHQKKKQNLFI